MLDSVSPLNGYSATINEVTISEITRFSMVSLAVPGGDLTPFTKAVKQLLKTDIPAPGKLTRTTTGSMLVWMSADQYFYLFETEEPDPAQSLKAKFKDAAYLTNQSDGWVMLRVGGSRKNEAMERISQIDLSDRQFPVYSACRTMMEHLGVLVLRDEEGSFLLLTARSYAKSLLHAIEMSAKNI